MTKRASKKGMAIAKPKRLIDFTEISDGEDWEFFANDFLIDLGFVVEIGPSRGPDGGKDLIIIEQLKGIRTNEKFRWLVSCKHYATSGKSIGTKIETDILDRVKQHNADGFMGFYSTPASSSLIERLEKLKLQKDFRDYTIYTNSELEKDLIYGRQAKLFSRFFPKSFLSISPVEAYLKKYVPLPCIVCGKDLLMDSIERPMMGLVGLVRPRGTASSVVDVYVACKGTCDRTYEGRLFKQGFIAMWWDIGDIVNPAGFLESLLTYADDLGGGHRSFSEKAQRKLKSIYIAVSQRTLRPMSATDIEHFNDRISFGFLSNE